jgi:hypothetical protein
MAIFAESNSQRAAVKSLGMPGNERLFTRAEYWGTREFCTKVADLARITHRAVVEGPVTAWSWFHLASGMSAEILACRKLEMGALIPSTAVQNRPANGMCDV